jgi:hypothetical protein
MVVGWLTEEEFDLYCLKEKKGVPREGGEERPADRWFHFFPGLD